MTDKGTNHEWTEADWKKTLYAIFDRSTEDPAFRQACEKDPRVAFMQVAGLELPPDVHVTFDASQDAASIPNFKDAFIKHKPVTVRLPATKTLHSMTPR